MHDTATSSDGITIAFEVTGDGSPALVLVHGWSCDRTYWRGQRELADRFRVVTVDLAGHGESGVGRRSWTMAAFGADVAEVVEQLDLDDIVLVGHSMGGDVIVEAALLLGARVRGLVWIDVYRSLDDPLTPEQVEAFVEPFERDFATKTREFIREMFPATSDPALADWVAGDMAAAPPAIAVDAVQHSIANLAAAVAGLDRLGLPVVTIDPDDEPTDVASMARHGVETVMVSGVGHFLMLENPAEFNRALVGVVERFAGRS